MTSAIHRTPSGVAFTDDPGCITGGERAPFAAPIFRSLSNFDRAIGDAEPLSVVTVENNTAVAALGGLQIELSGVKAMNVIVLSLAGGTTLPNR